MPPWDLNKVIKVRPWMQQTCELYFWRKIEPRRGRRDCVFRCVFEIVDFGGMLKFRYLVEMQILKIKLWGILAKLKLNYFQYFGWPQVAFVQWSGLNSANIYATLLATLMIISHSYQLRFIREVSRIEAFTEDYTRHKDINIYPSWTWFQVYFWV